MSSIVGRIVVPFGGVYTTSKWALEALAETSSYELAPFGIDVAIVQPGAFPTEIFAKVVSADDTARIASYGEVAGFANAVSAGLDESSKGKNPQDVADAIARLVELPAGQRPLRTIVADVPAITAINEAVAPLQRGVIAGFGLGALLPKALA